MLTCCVRQYGGFRLSQKSVLTVAVWRLGTRIWPQFRLHSIVFAHRSLACMGLTWLRVNGVGVPAAANTAVVFATMAAADMSTAAVPVPNLWPRLFAVWIRICCYWGSF